MLERGAYLRRDSVYDEVEARTGRGAVRFIPRRLDHERPQVVDRA